MPVLWTASPERETNKTQPHQPAPGTNEPEAPAPNQTSDSHQQAQPSTTGGSDFWYYVYCGSGQKEKALSFERKRTEEFQKSWKAREEFARLGKDATLEIQSRVSESGSVPADATHRTLPCLSLSTTAELDTNLANLGIL